MKAKRITAFALALLALTFWLSAGIFYSTGAFAFALEAVGLNSRWAVLGGLPVTLAGLFLSIWALRRWSR